MPQLKPLTARRLIIFLLAAIAVNIQSIISHAQDGGASSGVTYSGGMSGQAIMTVSSVVVILTQMAKWGGVPDRRGPLAVMALSLVGVAFWGWSTGDFSRASSFGYFAGWVAVASSAAGVFGFIRATPAAITSTTPPPAGPAGAGSSVTT